MSLPWNVNASMGGAGVNYQIQRSLRFRNSATAYLSRSPASAGNQQKMTFSFWMKRGQLGVSRGIYCSGASGSGATQGGANITVGDTFTVNQQTNNAFDWVLTTTQVFRDPSAWYHVVVAIDTTQATSSNRVLIYVNGVQVTSFSASTYPTLNLSTKFNASGATNLGATIDAGAAYIPFDGYFAEVNFIDGQQLTPASFGYNDPVTGVWQPAPFKGTYGTNGFYLPFTDIATTSGSNFGLGRDYSGNANYWTTNNISVTAGSTYDSMIDSPTSFSDGSTNRGNYCVGNPLLSSSSVTFSNANLTVSCGGGGGVYRTGGATFGISSGKWYWEFLFDNVGGNPFGGVGDITVAKSTWESDTTINSNFWYVSATNGNKYNGNGGSGGTAYGPTYAAGDLCMVALDMDNGYIWFGKNGTWSASGSPSTGTNAAYTNIGGRTVTAAFMGGAGAGYTNQYSMNFGQRPFSYTPPTGFKALNTFNLPTPTIANGAAYMAATLWTGNGTSQSIANSQSNGGNNPLGKSFYPDFVWYKGRTTTYNHALFDTIRGTLQRLSSNLTSAETATAGSLTAFNSNGFSIGNDAGANQNTGTYVAWQWLAGAGTTSTNTSGSITSTVSVSAQSGFSVVTYTGTGANATVGHSLGVAPSMVIVKPRVVVDNWNVYHASNSASPATQVLYLNLTNATSTNATIWNNTAPTSSVFSIGTNTGINTNGSTYVAYCFAAVRGYSAFGSYTGNGSTDGPFIYTGFRPRWIMGKRTNLTGVWWIYDTSRDTYNVVGNELLANDVAAETAGNASFDILSNGFKLRTTGVGRNGSGDTFIYAAFAENPFNYSRAR